jgi:hypothetical protein
MREDKEFGRKPPAAGIFFLLFMMNRDAGAVVTGQPAVSGSAPHRSIHFPS